MGRRKKYFSPEEIKEANRAKVLRYYWRNKDMCDEKARQRYWDKKLANTTNGSSGSLELIEETKLQLIEVENEKQ